MVTSGIAPDRAAFGRFRNSRQQSRRDDWNTGAMHPPSAGHPGVGGATKDPRGERVRQFIGGRYRLERIVGKGAMGRVWAAHDELLNRPVAIKEVDFPPGMPASEVEQLAQRTMREARAIASVSDPHVVTIYDMLSLPHGPAIVM